MKGRIKFTPPSYIGMNIDWNELVTKPFQEGRIIEAFASADALIDEEIESCLRQIYYDFKCQDLINEMHILRGKVNFDGLILLEILKSKTIVDEPFVQRVRQFKLARNLVLHNQEGEYALIVGNLDIAYNSQEELDNTMLKEAKKWIGEGFEIFNDLIENSRELDKNKEYYFSHEFYKKNPRGKQVKRKFPKGNK
ncbi:MAG: hypothetical protein ABIE94_04745 [archaeon]